LKHYAPGTAKRVTVGAALGVFTNYSLEVQEPLLSPPKKPVGRLQPLHSQKNRMEETAHGTKYDTMFLEKEE
jgi:hypothetical protein